MLLLNFTKGEHSAILNEAFDHWNNITPHDMRITPITALEANVPFEERYISDAYGLERLGLPNPVRPAPCIMSLITWQQHAATLAYRERIQKHLPQASISSTHYMDKGGYMAWHTNQGESPEKPHRLYVTYNDVPGSLFRYIVPSEGNVITLEEPVGWYAKLFYVEDEFPHCLYANGPRWSLGMRF